MTSRDLRFDSVRVENPSQDPDETPDIATSTPRHEAETTFAPPGHPQQRAQVVIGDTTSRVNDQPAEAMVTLAHSLNNLLQQFTTQVTRLNARRERPTQTYSGLIHENPTAFVNYIEQFFVNNNVGEDNLKIEIFKGQLKDPARKWSQAFEGIPLSYQAFRESFLRKYNSTTDRSDAISMLYGEKQKPNESVEVFITRKRSLFARLNPNIEETVMAQVIVDQLLPPIRSKLRGQVFTDILELAHYAGKAESDAADEAAYWKQLYAPANRTPAPPSQRTVQLMSQQPGPARTVRPQASTSPAPRENNPPPRRDNVDRPPTPCRFCQGWHFHRECPRNPYRGHLNSQRAPESRGSLQGNSAAQPPQPRQPTSVPGRHPNNRPNPRNNQIQVVAEVHAEAEDHPRQAS